jgi:hypothetical protein
MNQYEKQANDFLATTQTEIKVEFLEHGKHFANDTETRDIYKVTFSRNGRKFNLKFGQSIAKSGFFAQYGKQKIALPMDKLNAKKSDLHLWVKWNTKATDFGSVGRDSIHYPEAPTAYDVLACLTKYDVDSFDDFCSEFGYDADSRTAKKTYKAVRKEFSNVQKIWSDSEIEALQEIQ